MHQDPWTQLKVLKKLTGMAGLTLSVEPLLGLLTPRAGNWTTMNAPETLFVRTSFATYRTREEQTRAANHICRVHVKFSKSKRAFVGHAASLQAVPWRGHVRWRTMDNDAFSPRQLIFRSAPTDRPTRQVVPIASLMQSADVWSSVWRTLHACCLRQSDCTVYLASDLNWNIYQPSALDTTGASQPSILTNWTTDIALRW